MLLKLNVPTNKYHSNRITLSSTLGKISLANQRKADNLNQGQQRLNDLAQLAINNAGAGLWEWNLERDELYLSPEWKKMIGYKEQDIVNIPQSWLGRIHPEDIERFSAAFDIQNISGDHPIDIEYRIRHRDGTYLWMHLLGKRIQGEDLGNQYFCGLQISIDTAKRFEIEVLKNKSMDSLTGVSNRMVFMSQLGHEFNLTKRL